MQIVAEFETGLVLEPIVTMGKGLTTMVPTVVLRQPKDVVPVTVYEVVDVGLTVIESVVVPVDQEYELAPLAVSVAELPAQIVAELTVTTGNGLTITVCITVSEQVGWLPDISVTV